MVQTGKLARHDQRNKPHSKENKPIEFRRCRCCSSIFFQSVLLFSYLMCFASLSSRQTPKTWMNFFLAWWLLFFVDLFTLFFFFSFFFFFFLLFFFFIFFAIFLLNKNTFKINRIRKRMGCLPPSAFFYIIELDASTMIERIYHPSSSSSCLAGIPWTWHKESDTLMHSLLII